jgi:tetratricopeptide (TPR) repeat protein
LLPVVLALAVPVTRASAFQTAPPTIAASPAVADTVRRAIEAAVERGTLEAIRGVRLLVARARAGAPDDVLLRYFEGYRAFRETGLLLGMERGREAGPAIVDGLKALEAIPDAQRTADCWAMLSSLYGQRMATSRNYLLAVRLGPASQRAMDRAVALAPENPRVWLLKGLNTLNTPPAFGGGADKAEGHLRKAIALFTTDAPAPPAPSWGLGDAWLWLGRSLQEQGKRGEARLAYVRAAELQPWNRWLADVLLPAVSGSGDA